MPHSLSSRIDAALTPRPERYVCQHVHVHLRATRQRKVVKPPRLASLLVDLRIDLFSETPPPHYPPHPALPSPLINLTDFASCVSCPRLIPGPRKPEPSKQSASKTNVQPRSFNMIFLPVVTFSMNAVPGPSSSTTLLPIFAIAAADANELVAPVTWNFKFHVAHAASAVDLELVAFGPMIRQLRPARGPEAHTIRHGLHRHLLEQPLWPTAGPCARIDGDFHVFFVFGSSSTSTRCTLAECTSTAPTFQKVPISMERRQVIALLLFPIDCSDLPPPTALPCMPCRPPGRM